MTPPAMTAAGRTAPARRRPATAGPPGHRRKLSQPAARPATRRVSGPAGGRYRPATAPRTHPTFRAQALAVVRSLPEHSLIDRLVRGRAWIPVLGVLLAGIVAMQVEVLKLNTSMGRSIARGSTLQSQNELLQASVASLADDQRIERLAAGMGMVMPAPTGVAFLSAQHDGNVGRAIANIHAPDPAGFAAQLSAQLAASASAAGLGGSTSGAPGATPAGAASTASTPASSPTAAASPASATGSTSNTGASNTGASSTTTTSSSTAQGATPTGSTASGQGPATGAAAVAPPGQNQASTPVGG